MIENNSEEKFFSLFEFCQNINNAISSKFGRASYWIQAEIANFKMTGGHCYLTLIEKESGTTDPKASIKGLIWGSNFFSLNKKFKDVTGSELQVSIKILFLASVNYHLSYGLSLNITDIKPEFTLGSLLQERNDIVRRLKDIGEYFLNKKKDLPLVPQRIAVISAKDSKGFEDFETKIINNIHNYRFFIKLFPAFLQGEKAAEDIKSKLIKIYEQIGSFDIVVILRGGGDPVNLNCFNNYKLSRAVARFPIPVITGIGHTANISVVDEVAYFYKINPTDVAHFIVELTYNFEKNIQRTFKEIKNGYDRIKSSKIHEMQMNGRQLMHLVKILKIGKLNTLTDFHSKISLGAKLLLKEKFSCIIQNKLSLVRMSNFEIKNANETLAGMYRGLLSNYKNFFKAENLLLKNKSEKISFLDPKNILKRGYSITLRNGKALTNTKSLSDGETIKTILFEGELESKIINTKQKI